MIMGNMKGFEIRKEWKMKKSEKQTPFQYRMSIGLVEFLNA